MLRSREVVFVLFSFLVYQTKTKRCKPIEKRNHVSVPFLTDFYLMQTCTLSEQEEIERLHVNNFDACKNEAIRLRGLAFNFADLERMENGTENCIIYECPEFNVTALKQYETVYHYYSAYANIWPSTEMTCIPREGLYMLTNEKLNYTEAVDKCDSYGGSLMNVITEEATRRAANVIVKSKIITNPNRLMAYVGLSDIEEEGRYFSLCGDHLVHSPWRGWAPGEPRGRYDNEDCVTIDSTEHWRVLPCDKRLPFLCEIQPNGPLNLTTVHCTIIEDAAEKQRCAEYYLNYTNDVMDLKGDDICERPQKNSSDVTAVPVDRNIFTKFSSGTEAHKFNH